MSHWSRPSGSAPSGARFVVQVDGELRSVHVAGPSDGRFRVTLDDVSLDVDARLGAGGPVSLLVDGASYLVDVTEEPDGLVVCVDGEPHRVRVGDTRRVDGGSPGASGGGQRLVASMPGKVAAVLVTVGQRVEPGTPLVVLEAMKMENEFRAATAGTVTEVHASPGQAVNAGDLLVVIGDEAS